MKLSVLKKGAMFGLDARVALVIFAAIGLVSTAIMHSAILESSVSRLVLETKDITKAIKLYEYDVDDLLPENSTAWLNTKELVSSSISGWNGPYVSFETAASPDDSKYLVNSKFGKFSVLKAKDRSATAETDSPFVSCATADPCYLWVLYESSSLGDVSDLIMSKLDKRFDSGDGFLTGVIQKYNGDLLYRLDLVEYYTPI